MLRVYIGNNVKRDAYSIDENTTLRAALEQAGIDYTIGMTSLDGSTLAPGDLDKTFADFGVAEKCYLLNVVKADNAAAIKIAGSACVIESAHTVDEIKQLERFRPNALKLTEDVNGKKEETFCVGVTSKGTGSVGQYGVSFAPTPSASGKAIVTLMIPEGVTDAKKWAADTVSVAIIKLNKVEKQFASALTEVKDEQKAVNDAITVM